MSALEGKQVIITRAPHQSGDFADLLVARGAVPLLYPCIDIIPPEDVTPLNNALNELQEGAFDWLVLTSANTVRILQQRFDALALNPAHQKNLKVATVGTETANAAREQLGLPVNLVPETYTAQALAEALHLREDSRVLLPQSAIAEPTLAAALADRGARVTALDAYRTVIGSGGVDLPALLAAGTVDVITLTSASTVTNLLQRFENEGGDANLLVPSCLACIGPQTAAAARQHELPVTVMPDEHTLAGLVKALEDYYTHIAIGEAE